MKTAEFTIPGPCVPQGSMKAFAYRKKGGKGKWGVNMTHQNSKNVNDYRRRFREVIPKYHDDFFVDDTDITYTVDIIFYIDKPESVGRVFPTVRGTGDVDKLIRAVLDALTYSEDKNPFGLFKDDSQVIRVIGSKLYTNESVPEPQTRIRITRLSLSSKKNELKTLTDFAEKRFKEKA